MTPKSILHRDFVYTPSGKTDIRKTFRRIRRELAEAQAASNVKPIVPAAVPLRRKARA